MNDLELREEEIQAHYERGRLSAIRDFDLISREKANAMGSDLWDQGYDYGYKSGRGDMWMLLIAGFSMGILLMMFFV